jgi:LruC domain-containing protein
VVYYRTAITQDVTGETPVLREIRISGEIVAVGAAFHSGFAVSIPGVRTRDVEADGIELLINNQRPMAYDTGQAAPFQPLRGTVSRLDDNALLEITRDVWTTVERGEGCFFHRTDNNCGSAAPATFDLKVPITGNVPASDVSAGVFNPFVFATDGYLRNSIFKDEQGNRVAPGDALEIHLKNHPPSWRADPALLGRSSDVSVATAEPAVTYQTAQGLPWAIEIGGRWCHPSEYQDITVAYPLFATYVTSEGSQARDWFHVSNAASHPERGAAGYLYRENGVLDTACAGSN